MILASYYAVTRGGGFLTYDVSLAEPKYRVTMDIMQAERFHRLKDAAIVAEAHVGIIMKITINVEEVR